MSLEILYIAGLWIAISKLNMEIKPLSHAVRLKGTFVFGTLNDRIALNEILAQSIQDCPDAMLDFHPFGLILQTLAKLNVSLAAQTGEKRYIESAEFLFDKAERSFLHGSSLLQKLAVAMKEDRSIRMTLLQTNKPIPPAPFADEKGEFQICFNYW